MTLRASAPPRLRASAPPRATQQTTLPTFARAEYLRRRELAIARLQRVRRADLHLAEAEWNARLAPWLAAAIRAGADLADVEPGLWQDLEFWRPRNPEGIARAIVADDICPREDMRAEIARARDLLLARQALGQEPDRERCQWLSVLATHLGAPAIRWPEDLPRPERKDAA